MTTYIPILRDGPVCVGGVYGFLYLTLPPPRVSGSSPSIPWVDTNRKTTCIILNANRVTTRAFRSIQGPVRSDNVWTMSLYPGFVSAGGIRPDPVCVSLPTGTTDPSDPSRSKGCVGGPRRVGKYYRTVPGGDCIWSLTEGPTPDTSSRLLDRSRKKEGLTKWEVCMWWIRCHSHCLSTCLTVSLTDWERST